MSSTPRTSVFHPDGDAVLLLGTLQEDSAVEPRVDQAPANDVIVDGGPIDEYSTDKVPTHDFAGNDDTTVRDSKNECAIPLDSSTRYGVRLQVSSKHLSLASQVFKDMFEDLAHSKPSKDLLLCNKNMASIPLPADDIDGMQILMNIVHGLTRSVPHHLNLQTFVKVAVLIDKYEFEEVAELYMNLWFTSLRPKMPQRLDEDLASWIFICWVLKKSDEYTFLTKIAMREITYEVELEIPDRIIRKIPLRNGLITF